MRVNVSDYCGLHYRQALLTSKAFGASATTRDFLRDEAELASSLIARFPGREALWAHRRFVFDARLRCGGDEGRAAPGPSDARERETRGDDDDDDDDDDETKTKTKTKTRTRVFFRRFWRRSSPSPMRASLRATTRRVATTRTRRRIRPPCIPPGRSTPPPSRRASRPRTRYGLSRRRGARACAARWARRARRGGRRRRRRWRPPGRGARRRRVGCVARASAAARAAVRERLSSVTVSDTKARSARSSSRAYAARV